jgi:hypothetical protein
MVGLVLNASLFVCRQLINNGPRDQMLAASRSALSIYETYCKSTQQLSSIPAAKEQIPWKDRCPMGTPTVIIPSGSTLSKLVYLLGVVSSLTQSNNLIKQGGVYVDGVRIIDYFLVLTTGNYWVRIGKKKHFRVGVH